MPAGGLHDDSQVRASGCARGGQLPIVASVTGTPGDYQGFARQKAQLEDAGVVVMPSNAQASMFAARVLQTVSARTGGAP